MSKITFVLCLCTFLNLVFNCPSYADYLTGRLNRSGQPAEGPSTPAYKAPPVPEGSIRIGQPGKFSVFKAKDGFGLVDGAGKVVIKPAPDYLFPLGDDLFARKQQREPCHYVLMDSGGKELAQFDQRARLEGKQFSEGLIIVNHNFSTINYHDKTGKPISEQDFVQGGPFSEGLANVRVERREQTGGGYIDHTGKFVIGPFPDAYCAPFQGGIGIVSYNKITPGGTWVYKVGALDKTGKVVVAANFDELSWFNKTFFLAKQLDRFCLVDISGRQVMQFPPGCRKVMPTGNDSSSQLIPCGFLDTTKPVGRDEDPPELEWGYSDMSGKLVTVPKFRTCESFVNGLAIASIKENNKVLFGLISENGSWQVKPSYVQLDRLNDGYFQYQLEKEGPVAATGSEAPLSGDRHEKFYELLRMHDVIGMTPIELHKYLGEQLSTDRETKSNPELLPAPIKSLVRYDASVEGRHCGNGSTQIELGLDKNQRVWGWRLNGMQQHGAWYTDNVVFGEQNTNGRLPKPKM